MIPFEFELRRTLINAYYASINWAISSSHSVMLLIRYRESSKTITDRRSYFSKVQYWPKNVFDVFIGPIQHCNTALLQTRKKEWDGQLYNINSKVQGTNMGPIWGRQDQGGPHVGPITFAIWVQ